MSRRRTRQRPARPVTAAEPLPSRDTPGTALAVPEPDAGYPRALTPAELGTEGDDTALTADLGEALRKLPPCQHCGGFHARACPRVKSMAFHPNGALAQVEFWADGRWTDANIVWPEDVETVS